MRILSEFFFGVTTIGAHRSVASVTGAMIPWLVSRSISFFSLSLFAKGIERGVVTQKGRAFLPRDIWNFSLGMVRICPSKTEGNLDRRASADSRSDSFRFSDCN